MIGEGDGEDPQANFADTMRALLLKYMMTRMMTNVVMMRRMMRRMMRKMVRRMMGVMIMRVQLWSYLMVPPWRAAKPNEDSCSASTME